MMNTKDIITRGDLVDRAHVRWSRGELEWDEFVQNINDIDKDYGNSLYPREGNLGVMHIQYLWSRGELSDDQYSQALSEIAKERDKEIKESTMLHNPDPDFEVTSENWGMSGRRHAELIEEHEKAEEYINKQLEEEPKMKRENKQNTYHDHVAKRAKKVIERPKTEGNVLDDLDYVNDNVVEFWKLTERMTELYSRKNRDYGNSFDESLNEDGLLNSKIRMNDKMRRFQQLIKEDATVKDESIEDTLMDIANYAIMTIKWMEENKDE